MTRVSGSSLLRGTSFTASFSVTTITRPLASVTIRRTSMSEYSWWSANANRPTSASSIDATFSRKSSGRATAVTASTSPRGAATFPPARSCHASGARWTMPTGREGARSRTCCTRARALVAEAVRRVTSTTSARTSAAGGSRYGPVGSNRPGNRSSAANRTRSRSRASRRC